METEKIPVEQESNVKSGAGRHPSELVRISRERYCPKDFERTGDRFAAALLSLYTVVRRPVQ